MSDEQLVDDEDEIEPCEPEFVDGQPYGCGVCPDCRQQEYDEIEHAVEMGDMTEDEALELHARNGVY